MDVTGQWWLLHWGCHTEDVDVWMLQAGVEADYGLLRAVPHSGESREFCVSFNPRFRSLPAVYSEEVRPGHVTSALPAPKGGNWGAS